MTIVYDPHQFTTGIGFLKVLASWCDTVLPNVVRSGLFWFNLCLHIAFQLLARWLNPAASGGGGGGGGDADDGEGAEAAVLDDVRRLLLEGRLLSEQPGVDRWAALQVMSAGPQGLPFIDWRVATTTMSLMVFFLVFMTITEFGRYNVRASAALDLSTSAVLDPLGTSGFFPTLPAASTIPTPLLLTRRVAGLLPPSADLLRPHSRHRRLRHAVGRPRQAAPPRRPPGG